MQPNSPDYKFLYEQTQSLYEQSQLEIAELKQQLQQLRKMIFASKQERFIQSIQSRSVIQEPLLWLNKNLCSTPEE
jgi:cell shape-determining protein MreC